ncbi:vitronectin a [Engraulis encrasicolus]|uniref:vitronectin a n=1 Tax=Engraulis encrasicolus TaxID=184585 RepID=UPI002FCF3681
MRPGLILLTLLALATTSHSQESCMDRCELGFDSEKKCQCDTMCKYYSSCCSDYETACRMHIRGDTFVLAEDDEEEETNGTDSSPGRGEGRAQGRQADLLTTPPPTPTVTGEQRTVDLDVNTGDPIPTTHSFPSWTPSDTLSPSTISPSAAATTGDEDRTTGFPGGATDVSTTGTDVSGVAMTTGAVGGTTEAFGTTVHGGSTEPTATTTTTTTEAPTTTSAPPEPTQPIDPDAEACSGRPFDAFLQLKNGTIFAFRGQYFFGLDEKSVMRGYPRLIKDVWGISGPIDAAFTRINCQGKTYIFKGNKYWRFEDEVLDEDFPRDINVGFTKIPDDVDAAFSIPAHGHHGHEKVYFFKGEQYYLYEFKHQPTHEECAEMSVRSPSVPFQQYNNMYYDSWQDFYNMLFGRLPESHHGPHFIHKDWKGLKAPVDAVMAGRLYITSRPPPDLYPPPPPRRNDQQQWGQQYRQQYSQDWEQQYGRRRQNRSPPEGPGAAAAAAAQGPFNIGSFFAERGMNIGREFAERGMNLGREMAERGINIGREFAGSNRYGDYLRDLEDRWRDEEDRRRDEEDRLRDRWRDEYSRRYDYDYRYFYDVLQKSQPVQAVYFFRGDKYYRVDLKSKRVDPGNPPYPRPIAKFWLGCKDKPGEEK